MNVKNEEFYHTTRHIRVLDQMLDSKQFQVAGSLPWWLHNFVYKIFMYQFVLVTSQKIMLNFITNTGNSIQLSVKLKICQTHQKLEFVLWDC